MELLHEHRWCYVTIMMIVILHGKLHLFFFIVDGHFESVEWIVRSSLLVVLTENRFHFLRSTAQVHQFTCEVHALLNQSQVLALHTHARARAHTPTCNIRLRQARVHYVQVKHVWTLAVPNVNAHIDGLACASIVLLQYKTPIVMYTILRLNDRKKALTNNCKELQKNNISCSSRQKYSRAVILRHVCRVCAF